jgi:excisionase family DNA binding protein
VEANVLTVSEVAKRLGLGLSTIYDLIARGKLQAYKHGGTYRVHESDLVAYLASVRVQTETPARTPATVPSRSDWRAQWEARKARQGRTA